MPDGARARRSPAFVPAPEGRGYAERFSRTRKEDLLWIRSFDAAEQLRQALIEAWDSDDSRWLVQRRGFRPPGVIRAGQLPPASLAA